MVTVGSFTARRRARAAPDALVPIALALATAAVVTIGLVLALGTFKASPRYLVPVGGMVIGTAMTAAAVPPARLAGKISTQARRTQAPLALGATPPPHP